LLISDLHLCSAINQKNNLKMKKLIIAIIVLTVTNASFGQTSANQSQNFSMTLNNVIDISVTGTPSATFANTTDYDNGVTVSSAAVIAIKSNKNWTLAVKAASANFTGTPSTIPASILQFKLSTGGSFAGLSTNDANVTTGNKGNNGSATVDYKVVPGYSYEAGNYTLSVVYTATQQ
jgi:hypothetical protein